MCLCIQATQNVVKTIIIVGQKRVPTSHIFFVYIHVHVYHVFKGFFWSFMHHVLTKIYILAKMFSLYSRGYVPRHCHLFLRLKMRLPKWMNYDIAVFIHFGIHWKIHACVFVRWVVKKKKLMLNWRTFTRRKL